MRQLACRRRRLAYKAHALFLSLILRLAWGQIWTRPAKIRMHWRGCLSNSYTCSLTEDDGAVVGIGTEVAGVVEPSSACWLGVPGVTGVPGVPGVGEAPNAARSHRICSSENGGTPGFDTDIPIRVRLGSQLKKAQSKEWSQLLTTLSYHDLVSDLRIHA